MRNIAWAAFCCLFLFVAKGRAQERLLGGDISLLPSYEEAGAVPDLIQVGNEITNGMMWPVAKVNPLGDDCGDCRLLFA